MIIPIGPIEEANCQYVGLYYLLATRVKKEDWDRFMVAEAYGWYKSGT